MVLIRDAPVRDTAAMADHRDPPMVRRAPPATQEPGYVRDLRTTPASFRRGPGSIVAGKRDSHHAMIAFNARPAIRPAVDHVHDLAAADDAAAGNRPLLPQDRPLAGPVGSTDAVNPTARRRGARSGISGDAAGLTL